MREEEGERKESREVEKEREGGRKKGWEGEMRKEEEKGEAERSIPPSSRLPITMSQKLVVTKPSSATIKIAS